MNRYVMVPENVQMKNQDGSPTGRISVFSVWFCDEILVDPKAGQTAEMLFMANDIRQKARTLKGGDVLELTEREWEFVCGLIKAPANGYNPAGAFQILHFLRAVLDAKTEKPEAKAA